MLLTLSLHLANLLPSFNQLSQTLRALLRTLLTEWSGFQVESSPWAPMILRIWMKWA
jgi:hypothetical protein